MIKKITYCSYCDSPLNIPGHELLGICENVGEHYFSDPKDIYVNEITYWMIENSQPIIDPYLVRQINRLRCAND